MTSPASLLSAACLCVLLLATPAPAAEVENANSGFSVTVPDDFKPDPEVAAANADFLHAFTREDPEGGLATVVIIERMRGRIGRQKLDPAKLPPGFKGKLFTARWNGFDIEAVEVPETLNGVPTVTYNAQVPLKNEAVQVRVVGPRAREAELRALLDQLLGGLKGETNWLRSSAPAGLAASPHYGAILLGALVVGLVLGMIVLWLVRRRSPRGTVLVLAVLIYAASWATPVGRSRELRMLTGGLRLLGFIGVVYGLVDAFRRRPAVSAGATPALPPPEVPG